MASAPVRVTVDVHEGKRMVVELAALGAEVAVESLAAGDYVVAPRTAVERKTVLDFHPSLVEGRLWVQTGKLRSRYRWGYLIVEGPRLDNGPVSPAAIRGAILALMEQGIRVIQTSGQSDSALWIYRLAVRRQRRQPRDRPAYALRPPPSGADPAEAMLAAIPGLSVANARALLERFGTVPAVIAAGSEEWQRVRGIGPRRAANLIEALRLSQPAAAKAPGRAT
jgi:DNA excision repair protein ERCC-4